MKKHFCILIMLSFIISLAQPLFLVSAEMTSSDALNGYKNICLTYTFDYYNTANNRSSHSVEDFLPYVGYYDKEGNVKDYFFDSFLFLPSVGFGPSGGSMFAYFDKPSKAIDWRSYVEDTFKTGYNVDALNTAFGQTKTALGDDSDKKAGVFFTILYPVNTATDFGELGGKELDFSDNEDRKYAIKWIIDEQLKLFDDGEYENLETVGFYWLEEYVFNYEYTAEDLELFEYASDYLHSLGLKFIWIPWYMAYGTSFAEDLGFDAVCMQPNLFWMDNGKGDPNRVKESCEFSANNGLCMEMEIDYRAFVSDEYYERYLIYLEDGMNYGAMDSIKMYYQDKKPAIYATAANSDKLQYRIIYDLTYKYAKCTLTQTDIDYARKKSYPPEEPVIPDEPNIPDEPEMPIYKLGDINADGNVDQYDYILCKRIYFDNYFPSESEMFRANVDKKGNVDQYDYLLLKRHHFGTYVIE